MIDTKSLRDAWSILSADEKRSGIRVLFIMAATALFSGAMVGSVFPFLSVLSNPSLVAETPALKWVFQLGGFETEYQFLVGLGVACFLVIVAANLLLFINNWSIVLFCQMLAHRISTRLLENYLAKPYEFFISGHSGDFSSNVLAEVQQFVGQFLRPFAGLVSSALVVCSILTVLMVIDPVVAVIVIIGVSIGYGSTIAIVRVALRKMGKRRAEANKLKYRIAGESFGGIKDIKLAGREADYVDRFAIPSLEIARLQTKVAVISATPQFVLQTLAFGGMILFCLLLLDPTGFHERAALADLLPLLGVLAFAGQRVVPQIQAMFSAFAAMTYAQSAVERVYEDLRDYRAEQLTGFEFQSIGLKSSLVLSNLKYFYPDSDLPSLQGLSLEIRAGERIGVVGASGAGKSTLAHILLGLLQPQSGQIVADGISIEKENIRSWQRGVGYVPQDIFLIDASLNENIAIGTPASQIDPSRIEYSSRVAQLHDFVMGELPKGYETNIGERGIKMSGGQRQRIGIARALYQDADFIVFDEATSALDNMTEREVMTAVEALPDNKTVLVIAHRLSTLMVCDRIAVMENGSIVDCDTWDALMKSSHAFRRIADAA